MVAFSRGLLEHKEHQRVAQWGLPKWVLGLHPSRLFSLLHGHPGPWSGHGGAGSGAVQSTSSFFLCPGGGWQGRQADPSPWRRRGRGFLHEPGTDQVRASPLTAVPVSPGTAPNSPVSLPESPVTPGGGPWSDECTICYEHAVDTVIYTCGHMCLCYACGLRLKKALHACCPICRRPIKDIIKTYRSS